METLTKKINMVKITPFEYVVLNKISDKVTHVMMSITDKDVAEIKGIILYNKDNENNKESSKISIVELNNFIININNIVMYGESNSDLPKVESIISTILPDILGAPGHINKDTLEVSIEMVCGCTTRRFYNYYCTLIGNPKNLIIFKHYGTFE